MIYPLDKGILNTKTLNIFCCVNENSTNFLYTLNSRDKKMKSTKNFGFSFWFQFIQQIEHRKPKII